MHIPRGFSFRRKLPLSSKVFLSVAAVCAIASFLLVRSDAVRTAGERALTGPMVPVVVASHDVDAGTTHDAESTLALPPKGKWQPREQLQSRQHRPHPDLRDRPGDGRHGIGISGRSNALDLGFHGVPAGLE